MSALLALLAGCSLAGLGDLELPRCADDQECAPLNAELAPDACEAFRCSASTRRCALASVDADGDGDPPMSCGGGDCDDLDASRSTSATELCNGLDDDCDTLLDGPDEDDDGDGRADLCAGLAAVGDCDDRDPFTYLGATELCDGLDNDCVLNGVTRVGGGRQPEAAEDVDGDLHAAMGDACMAGPMGEMRFFPVDDCDDEAPTTYGGALEACDGVDNDCDGTLDNVPGTTTTGSTCLPTRVFAGYDNSCALDRFGKLVCWGDNSQGQLGDAQASDDSAIVVPFLTPNPIDVAIGGSFACALNADGTVTCWGTSAVLERVISSSFTNGASGQVPGVERAVAIAAGGTHACAVRDDGTVVCWGFAVFPVFDGVFVDRDFSTLARETPGIDDAIDIGTSTTMTCVLRESGQVWCFGLNIDGMLGTGMADAGPDPVPGINDATDLVVGDGFGCALRADGSVWCWGGNGSGQAGCPSCGPVARMPGRVNRLDGVTVEALVAGGSHACVVASDGTLRCWGSNAEGQIGTVDDMAHASAYHVMDVSGVREAALGGGHTCVRTDAGISCFGRSGARQLGDGRNDHSPGPSGAPFWRAIPQPASVLAHPIRIAGGLDETCFLTPDSRVRCAGSDAFGEIGGPRAFGVAQASFDISDAVDVSVGYVHSCIVKRDGRLHCAGQNTQAQIGNVTEGIVMGVEGATDVACGHFHTCVRKSDGSVACFGNHRLGQLGTSTLTDPGSCMGFVACSRTPQRVTGIDEAEAIAAGADHTCALLADGTVECWGDNELGELGAAPRGQSRVPRRVTGLPPRDRVVEIDAGEDTTCAVVESGHVWCWGRVLGAPGGTFTVDPTEVLGLTNVAEIALSQRVLCARLRSGALRCLGNATHGELGNGTAISDTMTPVIPRFIEDATTIGCGFSHCCAVRTSGQAMCWGRGGENQLGRPSTADSSVPVSTYSLTRF